jgi:hypothetical protein
VVEVLGARVSLSCDLKHLCFGGVVGVFPSAVMILLPPGYGVSICKNLEYCGMVSWKWNRSEALSYKKIICPESVFLSNSSATKKTDFSSTAGQKPISSRLSILKNLGTTKKDSHCAAY